MMEQLGASKNTDEKIGTYLKNRRLAKGIELRYISQKTKINPNILHKLEENQFTKLPGKTYLRGFVSSYARVLETDVNEALFILDNSLDGKSHSDVIPSRSESKILSNLNDEKYQHEYYFNPTLKLLTNRPLLLSIVSGLALIGSVTYFFLTFNRPMELGPISRFSWPIQLRISDYVVGNFYRQIVPAEQFELASLLPTPSDYLSSEKYPGPIEFKHRFVESELPQPEPTVAEMIPEVPSPTATATVTATATIAVMGTPVAMATLAAATITPTPSPTSSVVPEQVFRPFTTPIYQLNGQAEELKDPAIFPEKIKYASVPGKQNVFINAYLGDTWVTYKQDDAPIKSFNLLHGKTLLIRGNLVLLFIGRSESAKIFLNGEFVVTGVKSGVKSFVFPQEMASEYAIPLFVRDKSNVYYTSKEYQAL